MRWRKREAGSPLASYHFTVRILTRSMTHVKRFLSLGEFAQDAAAEIFNPYLALQAWAGTPGAAAGPLQRQERETLQLPVVSVQAEAAEEWVGAE